MHGVLQTENIKHFLNITLRRTSSTVFDLEFTHVHLFVLPISSYKGRLCRCLIDINRVGGTGLESRDFVRNCSETV